MCELFGYSGDREQSLGHWLTPFRWRGGGNADNPDGWGVAAWHGDVATLVKSAEAGFSSERFARLSSELRKSFSSGELRVYRDGDLIARLGGNELVSPFPP
jgi:predicted glutamine amidotransferase